MLFVVIYLKTNMQIIIIFYGKQRYIKEEKKDIYLSKLLIHILIPLVE